MDAGRVPRGRSPVSFLESSYYCKLRKNAHACILLGIIRILKIILLPTPSMLHDLFMPKTILMKTAVDVASLRPSTSARANGIMSPKCSYSNSSSQKLYSLLHSLHSVGGYSHTFGALDPVQVVQMAPRKFIGDFYDIAL